MAAVIAKLVNRPIMRANQPLPMFCPAAHWVDVVQLNGSAASSYTVPVAVSMIRLTPTALPTYGCLTGTAAAPTAGVTNGSASFPVGGQTWLGVNPGDVLSLISAVAGFVTIEAWT